MTVAHRPHPAPQSGSQSAPADEAVALLQQDRWDRLPLVGVGTAAQIRRAGALAVKIAHPGARQAGRLTQEVNSLQAIARSPDAWLAPRLWAVDEGHRALVRDWVGGACLLALLDDAVAAGRQPPWLGPLLDAWRATERWRAQTGEQLDFTPPNLFFDEARGRFRLVDLGVRLDPVRFHDLDNTDALWRALLDYRQWRASGEGRSQVAPPVMPPSGRFHVDTPVGPVPGARAVWVNEGALRRHRVPLDAQGLSRLAGIGTWLPPAGTLPSTRYQDAPHKGPGWAAGDGRAVRRGRVRGLDLMVKGCGPTALKWAGNTYHEDGLVSLNRTLWEAAIADELARLGIPSPEVLCVVPLPGQRTVDQTEVEWPAASALRAAPHHWRLGHLVRFSDDAGALHDLLRHLAWEGALKPDFDPASTGDLAWMVLRFARRLGDNTGRCDGLNIQCFNPTMGNVLVSGDFLDFSTVRFMRHYLPDFVYMNAQRRVREVRSAHRRHVGLLVDTLRGSGLISAQAGLALERRANAAYEGTYARGIVRALCTYLGLDVTCADDVDDEVVDTVDRAWRQLRRPRARARIAVDFWDQEVPAPLFDLEGRLPDLIDAITGGTGPAWPVLRSRFDGQVGPRDAAIAQDLERALRDLLHQLPPVDRPRRWDQIVRPALECQRLADLVYRRTREDRMGAFTTTLATSRALPEGRYSWLEARAEARRLGHVSAPVLGEGTHVVIGLYPELCGAIAKTVDDLLDGTLLAVLAHGPRVAPPAEPFSEAPALEERGADRRHTTPLPVTVLVSHLDDPTDRVLAALVQLLDAATQTLPLQLELIVAGGAVDAGRDAGRAWAELQGLAPDEVVLLHAPTGDRPAPDVALRRAIGRAPSGQAALQSTAVELDRLQPGVGQAPLSQLQLTLAMLDDDRCQPRPLPARRDGDGFALEGAWSGIVLDAARAAGRSRLVIDVADAPSAANTAETDRPHAVALHRGVTR